MCVNLMEEKSIVCSLVMTSLPGWNFSEEGFGVGRVWMNSCLNIIWSIHKVKAQNYPTEKSTTRLPQVPSHST